MGVIGIILLIAFVIICILLVGIVLIQRESGDGLGGGLIPQGGTHDGPLRQWSPWFITAGALGAGAAKRHGSPGGGTDCAGTGAADGDR